MGDAALGCKRQYPGLLAFAMSLVVLALSQLHREGAAPATSVGSRSRCRSHHRDDAILQTSTYFFFVCLELLKKQSVTHPAHDGLRGGLKHRCASPGAVPIREQTIVMVLSENAIFIFIFIFIGTICIPGHSAS